MTTLEQLANSLNGDPAHAFHVRRLALGLFDATLPLHALDAQARRILEAAALLHDIGMEVDAERHHKASRDMIPGLELPGLDGAARRMAACVARYHRGSDPEATHKVFGELDAVQQAVVRKLSALLRLADGLDRAHCAATTLVETDCLGGVFRIRVRQRVASPEDIEGAMKKRGLFEREFSLAVSIEVVK